MTNLVGQSLFSAGESYWLVHWLWHGPWPGYSLTIGYVRPVVHEWVKVAQSCLTLWDPIDGSLPGSSVCDKQCPEPPTDTSTSHFKIVQSLLSHVWLFATPWTAARQASPSSTTSWSLFKLMSIQLVMPSNQLFLRSQPVGNSTFRPVLWEYNLDLVGQQYFTF